MNQGLQTAYGGYGGSAVSVEQRNRVLRNTYWLLALSLIPTVAGAWLGVSAGFNWFAGSPFIGFLVFMGVAFGFFFAIEKTKNSALGVVLLLAFTFFMGLMLSRMIGGVLGNFKNGSQLIMMAFGGTALVFVGMATLATTIKRDLSGMGKWLMVGLIGIIIASVANIWLQLPALMLTVSLLAIGIFSAYMLYDLKRVIDGGETNYITATLSIYLDVYNVFAHLLNILGIFGGDSE
jgi:modulator of FtsH protease